MRPDLFVGSDHKILVTVFPTRGQEPLAQSYPRVRESDLPKFASLVEAGFQALPDPEAIQTAKNTNGFATAIEGVFKAAIIGAGKPDRGGGRLAP